MLRSTFAYAADGFTDAAIPPSEVLRFVRIRLRDQTRRFPSGRVHRERWMSSRLQERKPVSSVHAGSQLQGRSQSILRVVIDKRPGPVLYVPPIYARSASTSVGRQRSIPGGAGRPKCGGRPFSTVDIAEWLHPLAVVLTNRTVALRYGPIFSRNFWVRAPGTV